MKQPLDVALGILTVPIFSQAPILVKLGFDFHHFDINRESRKINVNLLKDNEYKINN